MFNKQSNQQQAAATLISALLGVQEGTQDGYLNLSFEKMQGVLNETLPPTTVIGNVKIGDDWYNVWFVTDRETNRPALAQSGNHKFRFRKQTR